MKYRRKPQTVEVIEVTKAMAAGKERLPFGCTLFPEGKISVGDGESQFTYITEGDFIVYAGKEPKPCRRETFLKTYERCE